MPYIVLAFVAFVLHVVWERLHIRLYTAYEKMEGRLPVFVFAALGDVLYTLIAVLGIALFKGDVYWFLSASTQEFALLAAIGFCIALFVEYKAILHEKWQYLPAMPIIPILHVGFSPIVQMTVLLPFSVYSTVALIEWLW